MHLRFLFLIVLAGVLSANCSSKGKQGEPSLASSPNQDLKEDVAAAKTKEPLIESRSQNNLDPKYVPLGQAVRAAKADAIVQEAAKILSTNPHDPVALNTLALYYFRRGKLGAAKLLLEKAFEKNQGNAALHNNLGVVLLADNEPQLAMASFKRAIKTDDNHAEALGNLGSIYLAGGDYLKAQPLLEQAYKMNRGNSAIANNYAITLRSSKNYDQASRIYEEILKQNSRNITALLNYSILLIEYMNKPKDGLNFVYKVKFLETERKDVVQRVNALEKKAKSELK